MRGVVFCLAILDERGRWTQHGRLSPEDLALLIEMASVE